MKKKFDRVYQFKITLRDSKPPIWRRIQVPEKYNIGYDVVDKHAEGKNKDKIALL